MKEISPRDILIGANHTNYFIRKAIESKDYESKSVKDLFEETKVKRKWSIINPGFILQNAYMYFVYGQENKLLEDFSSLYFDKINIIKIDNPDSNKSKDLKRRLRNSLAHCKYKFEIKTESGKISKDGDIWIKFNDDNNGKDKIEFEISLPDFANLIENAGEFAFNKINKNVS